MLLGLLLVTLSVCLAIGSEIPAAALGRLETALRRDLASPYPWCDPGEAPFEAQQVDQARYRMRRGLPGTEPAVQRRP